MNVTRLQTLQQVADFLHGSSSFEPAPATKTERYQWIDRTLRHFCYARLSKDEKGLLIVYLCKLSGYSRQQITRLIQTHPSDSSSDWNRLFVAGAWIAGYHRLLKLINSRWNSQ